MVLYSGSTKCRVTQAQLTFQNENSIIRIENPIFKTKPAADNRKEIFSLTDKKGGKKNKAAADGYRVYDAQFNNRRVESIGAVQAACCMFANIISNDLLEKKSAREDGVIYAVYTLRLNLPPS